MDNWLDVMQARASDHAEQMIAQHRCIICGDGVEGVQSKDGSKTMWHRKCQACAKKESHAGGDRFASGFGKSQFHREVLRRTGYAANQASGPDMRRTGEGGDDD